MIRLVFLSLAGLLVTTIAALLLFFPASHEGTLQFEAAKALLQLGVVSIVGAFVSLLVFEYRRDRQAMDKVADIERMRIEKELDIERMRVERGRDIERQALDKQRDIDRKSLECRDELLRSTLSEAMDAYGRAKKARRVARARAVAASESGRIVLAGQYDRVFDMVNDAQLDLETLARDIETSAMAFSDPVSLVAHLCSMESYLGELIGEYEKSRSKFAGDLSTLPLRDLPLFSEFIGPTEGGAFKASVVIPCRQVRKGIRADLLHPSLPGAAAATDSPTSGKTPAP